jgi:KaiC/GvpD/RAD55 family RecA-like ATPase
VQDDEDQVANDRIGRFRPLATGFAPLDRILTEGLRLSDLLAIGGPFGVGKTILGLQVAHNEVASSKDHAALYVCIEHDREHLMLQLLFLKCP